MKLISLLLLLFFTTNSVFAQIGPAPASSINTWRVEEVYSTGQEVIRNGVIYQSLVNNNKAFDPAGSSSQWSTVVGSTATPPISAGGWLNSGEVKMYKQTAVTFAANTTGTLFDITPGNSGTILSVQLIFCGNTGGGACLQSPNFMVTSFYTDGNASPDVQLDMGILGLSWQTAATGHISDAGASIGWSSSQHTSGVVLQYPFYFANEFKGTATCPGAQYTSCTYYVDVRYTTSGTSSKRLKSTYQTTGGVTGLNLATTTYDFLNVASGSGNIAALFLFTANASNYSYLEAGIHGYLDGESSPSYNSSGGEDFFTGNYYFDWNGTNPSIENTPWMYVAYAGGTGGNTSGVGVNVDLLAVNGGIPFNNGAKLEWNLAATGKASNLVTTSVDFGYLCLYYQ